MMGKNKDITPLPTPFSNFQLSLTKSYLKKTVILLVVFLFFLSIRGFSQQSQTIEKSSSKTKVSLDVKNMDIIDTLKILSDQGAFNISIGENVRGRVTLFLKDIDVWDALEIVLVSAGLAYEKIGDIIYIMAERDYELKYGEKYWDKRKIQVFSLNYASAARVKEFLAQVASNIGKIVVDEPSNTLVVIDTPERIESMDVMVEKIDKPLETKIFDINYLSVEDMEKKISEMVTKNAGVIKANAAANKIVVTDYPDKIKDIEKLLQAFDEKPLQVLIDAKIVEIKPSEKFYSGIDWDYWIEKYFRLKWSFPFPSTDTQKISMGTIGVTNVTAQGQHAAVMEFLKIFGDTRVLSTPRILALNNQEAKILVGTKEAYITSSSSSVGEELVTSQSVNFVDVGVKLYVTPTINRKDYITLKIKPEVSSSDTDEIKSEDKTTEVPIVTTTEAETSVIVKNGVSVIIGGLKKITREKEKKQIPILGDIPFLGAPFRSNKDEWTKNEIVILLTPYIISGDKSIEEELRENMRDIGEREIIDKFEDEMNIERERKIKERSKESSRKIDDIEGETIKVEGRERGKERDRKKTITGSSMK